MNEHILRLNNSKCVEHIIPYRYIKTMLINRFKYIICFAEIFAIVFLFVGHNFIHHDHDEAHDLHFESHVEKNHHDEHDDGEMSLNTHFHLFCSNTNTRNIIVVNDNVLYEYIVIIPVDTFEIAANKLFGIYHNSYKPKPRLFTSTLKDRSPPLS